MPTSFNECALYNMYSLYMCMYTVYVDFFFLPSSGVDLIPH